MHDKNEEVEQSIKAIAEYVKKQLAEMKGEFATKDDVHFMKQDMEKGHSEDFINRVQDLEDEIRELKKTTNGHELAELKKELQRDISDIRFEYDEKMMRQEKEFSGKNTDSLTKKLSDLEEELRTLRSKPVQPVTEVRDLQRRIDSLESVIKKNDVPYENEKIEGLEKELHDIKRMTGTKPIILAGFKQEMEKEMIKMKQDFEAKLRDYDERLKGNINSDDKRLEQDLEDLRKRLQAMQGDDSIEKQLRELRIKVRSMEQLPRMGGGEDLRHALEEEQAERMSLEKHVQDLRKEMEDLKAAPTGNNSKMKQDFEVLKKTVNDLRFTNKKGPGASEDLIDDINDLKHSLDEEIANRMSIEKHLQDMQQQLRDKKPTTETKIEYPKLIKQLQEDKQFSEEMDKRSKIETMRLITKQIEEYAHMLDKRLPNVATKDDLLRIEKRIDQRLKMPLKMEEQTIGRRMDDLEMSMNNLISVLRALQSSNRNPFVIE